MMPGSTRRKAVPGGRDRDHYSREGKDDINDYRVDSGAVALRVSRRPAQDRRCPPSVELDARIPIIDTVKPTRTFYALETMPWMYPDSADSYLRLLHAIDRSRFAVHLDVVNLVASPRLFYRNAALIRECVATLGSYIKWTTEVIVLSHG